VTKGRPPREGIGPKRGSEESRFSVCYPFVNRRFFAAPRLRMTSKLVFYSFLETPAYLDKMRFTSSINSDDQPAITLPVCFLDFPSPGAFSIFISNAGHLLRIARRRDVEQITGGSRSDLSRNMNVISPQRFLWDLQVEFSLQGICWCNQRL